MQQKASNVSHKHGQNRYHRSGSKRNLNSGPPLNVHHVPYYQPEMPHVYPPMILSPVPLQGYGYQSYPTAFPGAENQLSNAGSETPLRGFVPPSYSIDANRNIQPPRGDPNMTGPNPYNRRPNVSEAGARPYPLWHYPPAYNPTDGMMQQAMPRAYPQSSIYGPAPPYVAGPSFPGRSFNF